MPAMLHIALALEALSRNLSNIPSKSIELGLKTSNLIQDPLLLLGVHHGLHILSILRTTSSSTDCAIASTWHFRDPLRDSSWW